MGKWDAMDSDEQRRFFEGAVKHGTLDAAFWEVATRDAAVGQKHEDYVKAAFRLAIEAEVRAERARIAEKIRAYDKICATTAEFRRMVKRKLLEELEAK